MLLQLARKLFTGGLGQVDSAYVRELIRQNRLDEAARLAEQVREVDNSKDVEKKCLLGEIAFRRGADALAEELFRDALARAPGFPDAHHGLSLVMGESGRLEPALEHALFARTVSPTEARFLAQLGYCYLKLEHYPAAEAPLRTALKLQPKDKHSWNNLGVVMRNRPHLAEAKACFLQALELDPAYRAAAENLEFIDKEISDAGWEATVVDTRKFPASEAQEQDAPSAFWPVQQLLAQGKISEAVSLAEAVVVGDQPAPELKLALARTYLRAAEHDSALEVLEAAVDEFPTSSVLLVELGRLFLMLERPAAAEPRFHQAIELGADGPDVLGLLGTALNGVERYADSVEIFRRACADEPTTPRKKQLAAALIMACKYDEAIAIYEELLAREEVSRNEVIGNLACALAYGGRLEEAQDALDEALAKHSYDPGLRMMRAIVHLLYERYGEGWDDYEWRNFSSSRNFRALPFERWRGEPLEGKTIVVLAEQGLGDQVMFASCIDDLFQLEPQCVIVEAMDRVAKTLERSLPRCRVIATRQKKDMQWAAEVRADYYVRLADLPQKFRRTREDFPGKAYLTPDPERRKFWQERLEQAGPRPWIGISWKGGSEITRRVVRTVGVQHFCTLAQGLPATWINLQYGPVTSPLEEARRAGLHLHHWPEAIEDLDEFAALISALDCVLTVCNTTVHYAGAVACPTIVLAPNVPEWRYGLHFEKMPWYPDVTVLRQSVAGEWDGLFERARALLIAKLTI